MKPRHVSILLALLVSDVLPCAAQGTAFTYQGRLNDSGSPARGSYDVTFALYNSTNLISPIVAGPITNSAVAVTNGLFTTLLDFGPGIFTGTNYWLEIAVRTHGANNFTTLSPRQQLTPNPYAIYAEEAGSVMGVVPGGGLSGGYGDAVTFNNSANQFTGTFTGNGSGLTNLALACLNVLTAGVTNDGVTDVTVPLQNLLNQGGAFYFPAGRYLAQELTLTNNITLIGNGAVLVYANNAWNKNIFVRCLLNTNISIFGLGFDGGDYSDITTRTFQTYQGAQNFSAPDQYYFWNPTGLRHGLQFNTEAGGTISGSSIHGFGGIGLLPVSATGIDGAATLKTVVRGVNCYANFTGLFSSGAIGNHVSSGTNISLPNWISAYVAGGLDPEFMSYSGLNLFRNTIGLCASAGNCTYVNSAINGNLFGQLDAYGNNDRHGSINSILYTHNIDAALYIAGSINGEQIINCQFRDNGYAITLKNTKGITIDFCTFAPLNFTNQSSPVGGQNFFRNNTYAGTWAGQSLSTDGQLIYFGNHSYDTAGDNDGQPLTLLETGNGSGLTNLPASASPAGLTTTLHFTFGTTRTNTLYFSNGILENVTQP
jgi:Pectate lyase superfamily protein